MDGIKTIVFDLDGTIYQNFTFHRDYIGFLTEGTDKAAWNGELVSFCEDVFSGKRLVMNAFYKSTAVEPRDCASPSSFFATLEAAYAPEFGLFDAPPREEYIYLGDAWAVVTLIGAALGLFPGNRCNEVYEKTRLKMEADGMRGSRVLHDAMLEAGKRFDTVLLSNSYEKTAEEFLTQLGFADAFTKKGFSANKPFGMVDAFKKLCPHALDDPKSVLTVGDHAYNDLAPLARLGCKTLFVNPYSGVNVPPHDALVKNPDELARFLSAMNG